MKTDTEAMLDILGNKTRRKMMRLISKEPRCLTELSEETGVKKMSITRHLEKMEKAGILHREEKRIKRGRPRKYYGIDTYAELKVSVAPDDFETRLQVSKVGESRFYPDKENEFKKIMSLKETDTKSKKLGELENRLTMDIQKHKEAIGIDEDLITRIRKESLMSSDKK
ncbi:MAG: ArsR/SmtB family transcription factor [Candidatus Hydrothermarchaeales archaeon]